MQLGNSEDRKDNLNMDKKPEIKNQADGFPETTKLLDKKLKDKKEKILTVLEKLNSKDMFENLLSSATENRRKCIEELLNCWNDEEKIRGVILANLPEWSVYNVSTNEVVKTEVKKIDEYGNATTTDKKWEEAVQQEEEAVQQEEEAVQQEEKAVQQEEKAVQQEEEAAQQKEETEETKNLIEVQQENIIKALQEREKLLVWHEDIDEKTKKQAELAKQQLPEETKRQLEEKGYNEQFINDYILLRVTLNEVKWNPDFDKNQVAQFEKGVNELSNLDVILKNIDNSCKIQDTSLSSFNEKNISQTRTELFHEEVWNESLKTDRDDNIETHKDEYEKMFQMKEEDIITKYGKFLEWELKDFWNQYQNDSKIKEYLAKLKENNSDLVDSDGKFLSYDKIKDNPNLGDGDKNLLENYDKMRSAINIIKKDTDTKTIKMAEELRIISQIKWMYMCMWEWDDFDLNKAKEIESKKINGKNFLTLRWHIDWIDFAIRQDIDNPKARLQTSQRLARSEDGKNFSIDWEDNFVDSNFILPSQEENFESIKGIIQSDDKSLENSDNSDKYLESLQNNIMWKMEEKYENTKNVHYYMKQQVKWEKIVNKTLWTIRETCPNIANNENLYQSINQASNKDLYDFIKILKFNIDNSTDVEKDKLNKCITRILEITDTYKNNNGIENFDTLKYPSVIENYLKDNAWLNWWNENSRLKSLSDLFRYYSEKSRDTRANSEWIGGIPSKMVINDLYRDLFEFQWGQSETASTRDMNQSNKFTLQSNEKVAKEESQNADSSLRLDDPTLWSEW